MADKGKREEEILESFYETIKDEGIEGASIAKIAKRIDIPPSLVFHYFSSKDEMINKLSDYVFDKCKKNFLPDKIIGNNEREKFKYFVDVLFELRGNKVVDSSVFSTIVNLSYRNKEIFDKFKSSYRVYKNYIADKLRYFNEKNIISIDDEYVYAECLLTILEGLSVIDEMSNINGTPKEQEMFNRVVEMQKNFFLTQVQFK